MKNNSWLKYKQLYKFVQSKHLIYYKNMFKFVTQPKKYFTIGNLVRRVKRVVDLLNVDSLKKDNLFKE